MLATKEIGGINWSFRPDTNDLGIIEQVFTNNACHLPEDMHDMLFMDIGAHIGAVSVLAAMRGAKVIAFEPASSNYEVLVANASSMHLDIMPYRVGVGDSGYSRLYLDKYNTGQNSQKVMYPELDPGIFEDITVITLEEALRPFSICDFMKVDCEGCENKIIEDISTGLYAKIKQLYIEFHHQEQRTYIYKMAEHYKVEYLGYGYLFS